MASDRIADASGHIGTQKQELRREDVGAPVVIFSHWRLCLEK